MWNWQYNSLSALSLSCDQYCRVDQESWSTFPIGILMSARATSLIIVWSSRLKLFEQWILFQLSWSISHTFPTLSHTFPTRSQLPLCANKIEQELDPNHQQINYCRKQANGATSWTCNFQLDSKTWIHRHFLDQLLFIEHSIFNFLIKSLDQECWSRKLLVWQGLKRYT